jgi:hypothetical protein
MFMQFARLSTVSCGIALAVTIALGSGATIAQTFDTLPAAIVLGPCTVQKTVVVELRDANPPTGDLQGSETAPTIRESDTDARVRFNDLLASPHAIVVGDVSRPLNCGDIGGTVDREGDQTIGIAALDTPAHFAIADPDGDDDDDDEDFDINLSGASPRA